MVQAPYATCQSRRVREDLSAVNSPYRFDEQGRHSKTIDVKTGVSLLDFNYDFDGKLKNITDRFGDTVQINRDFDEKVTSIVSPDGYTTNLMIDSNNDLKEVHYEDGGYYTFNYNHSLLTSKTDPEGNLFIHEYDPTGRVYQTSDSEGGVRDFYSNRIGVDQYQYGHYTAEGNHEETIYSLLNGIEDKVTTRYDGTVSQVQTERESKNVSDTLCGVSMSVSNTLDSKTQKEIPSNITTTLPSGLSNVLDIDKSYADGGGDTTRSTIDVTLNGKLSSIYEDTQIGERIATSAEGRVYTSVYDPQSLLLMSEQIDGLFGTYYDYDSRGRLIEVKASDLLGQERSTIYAYDDPDDQGKLSSITTADGKTTYFDYDVMGRVSSITYPDGHSTQSSYDNNGNLTMLVVPGNQAHGFTLNGTQNLDSQSNPLNQTTFYRYDKEHKLKEIELPSGKLINHSYTNGLLSKTTTPETVIDYTYTCGGKIDTILEGSESLSYGYDGYLLTDIDYAGSLNQSISLGYDNNFWITSLAYAGDSTTLSYDNDGLLTDINGYHISLSSQNALPESVSRGTYNQTFDYNGFAERSGQSYSVNGQALYSTTLTRNEVGRITAKQEVLYDSSVNNYVYTYNDKRQLTQVEKNGQVLESYSYDVNGNRTQQSNSLRNISNQTAIYNVADQLQSDGTTTYNYTDDGYLSQKTEPTKITNYVYDSLGRLKQVSITGDNPKTITYEHNALGNRVSKSVNGTLAEKYLWLNLTTLLATYDASNNLKQRFEYTLGNTPTSYTENGNTYYIISDHLGSPRVITDASGSVLKAIEYDSFGNVVSDTNPALTIPFGFAGGLQDQDTGLIRFGYRDYDPSIGRWTALDPIGFAGGDTNLYGYVLGDPVNYIDLRGLKVIGRIGPDINPPKGAPDQIKKIIDSYNKKRSWIIYPKNNIDGEVKICPLNKDEKSGGRKLLDVKFKY